MNSLHAGACLVVILLSGCAIPRGEPIGASRLAIVHGPGGTAALTVPSCPDWQRDSREDFSNRTSSNFGCADAVNFIGQLADQADGIRGRSGTGEDGAAAAGGVERYRLHKTVPLATGQGGAAASAAPTGNPS